MKITQAPLSIAFAFLLVSSAVAALEPIRVREALTKKTESYFSEGIVTGGDREIKGGIVKDLRRASNAGFERIVLDLDSEKPPYYQVSLEPLEKRMVVTLFGNPHLALNAPKVIEGFKKSPLVQRVEFFPKVEEDTFIFALYLRASVPLEVFELSAPSRIIFDLKASPKFVSEVASPAKASRVVKPARAVPARPKMKAPAAEGNGSDAHLDDLPE